MRLPPYLGSEEQLIQELLHNPFLGSSHNPPHRLMADRAAVRESSQPQSGGGNIAQHVAALLVSAAAAKDTASAVSNKETANQITSSAENAITQVLDDFCETPPRAVSWPHPWPPPWIGEIASQLTVAANSLQAGSLRTSLLQISGRVIETGMGQAK
jgi:hypothetical protein